MKKSVLNVGEKKFLITTHSHKQTNTRSHTHTHSHSHSAFALKKKLKNLCIFKVEKKIMQWFLEILNKLELISF